MTSAAEWLYTSNFFRKKTWTVACFCNAHILRPRVCVLHNSSDYISFPLGSPSTLWYLWKWSSAHVYARWHKQCCEFHYCLWRVAIKPRLPLSICNVFFVSKSNLLDLYFTTLQLVLVPCSAVKRLPVLHNSADYICISFGSPWVYCGTLENEVLLMFTPEGVNSVANFISTYEESQ